MLGDDGVDDEADEEQRRGRTQPHPGVVVQERQQQVAQEACQGGYGRAGEDITGLRPLDVPQQGMLAGQSAEGPDRGNDHEEGNRIDAAASRDGTVAGDSDGLDDQTGHEGQKAHSDSGEPEKGFVGSGLVTGAKAAARKDPGKVQEGSAQQDGAAVAERRRLGCGAYGRSVLEHRVGERPARHSQGRHGKDPVDFGLRLVEQHEEGQHQIDERYS